MRIALNFAVGRSPRERYALAWAVPLALVGFAGLVLLLVSSVRGLREYRAIHRALAEQQERESHLAQREAALRKELERPQFRQVFHEAQFLNALIERKQVTLTELAERVSKLLPSQARLTGLALAPQGDELVAHFAIVGRGEEEIETFLSNLEDSPDFKDVAITNQGFEAAAAAGGVSIACTARYVPGAR